MSDNTLSSLANNRINSNPSSSPAALDSDNSRKETMAAGNVFTWETKVLFGDIDFYGVVYYLKYFDWCTRAREEFILSHHPDELGSVCPAVLDVTHKFLRSAKLLDRIRIAVTFSDIKRTSVQMNFDIYREDYSGRELLGTHRQKILFLTREGKIARMSPALFATVKYYERREPLG